jgi:hypothetical protein
MNTKTILKYILIGIFVSILLVIIFFKIIPCEKYDFKIDKQKTTQYKEWATEKIDYLRQIYPLGTNLNTEQFNKLECIFSNLLPKHFQNENLKKVYTAVFPGPSCSELPCDCDENNIPKIQFAPNPMLQNKWPPCNIQGDDAEECCKSVAAYTQCFKDKKVPWVANDTWTGNLKSIKQCPPEIGQLWKPSLWPKYTLAVNKFPADDWNSFYNADGDPDNYWMEGVHSSFSISNVTLGVWFYRAIGSGMFVNLGKTLVALNKIESIIKLGMDWSELADYILRPTNGKKLMHPNPDVTIDSTGLGGLGAVDYWLAGQYHTTLKVLFKERGCPMNTREEQIDSLVSVLKEAVYGKNYDLNRINNTGILDSLIIYLATKKGYNSTQFTVQANLYNGFTTEVMILGPGPRSNVYTDIRQLPKNEFRVMDPNNLPTGVPTSNKGKACTYDFPFACVYCKESPATMNSKMGCPVDISKWKCDNTPSPYTQSQSPSTSLSQSPSPYPSPYTSTSPSPYPSPYTSPYTSTSPSPYPSPYTSPYTSTSLSHSPSPYPSPYKSPSPPKILY